MILKQFHWKKHEKGSKLEVKHFKGPLTLYVAYALRYVGTSEPYQCRLDRHIVDVWNAVRDYKGLLLILCMDQ